MKRLNMLPCLRVLIARELTRIPAQACGVAAIATILAAPFGTMKAQSPPPPSGTDVLPDGPGKAVVVMACLSCHDAVKATSMRGTADDWANEVNVMMGRGAVLSDDEFDRVVEYLAAHFGPAATAGARPASSGHSAQPPSPEKTPAQPAPGAAGPPLSATRAATVNVNKAGADQLQSSLELSRQEAEAVVQYREQHGNFKNLHELESVPGVPPEKIKENQKLIIF